MVLIYESKELKYKNKLKRIVHSVDHQDFHKKMNPSFLCDKIRDKEIRGNLSHEIYRIDEGRI